MKLAAARARRLGHAAGGKASKRRLSHTAARIGGSMGEGTQQFSEFVERGRGPASRHGEYDDAVLHLILRKACQTDRAGGLCMHIDTDIPETHNVLRS